jgi:maltose/moltooligosaccharide transporter
MEPFRAFVADMLPEQQHTRGFTMQSMFIGLGAVIASALPFVLTNFFHLGGGDDCSTNSVIPMSVKLSFYFGAFAFISAVVYTVLTTKEYPPMDINEFQKAKEEKKGFGAGVSEIFHAITNMPKTMRQLALVQFLTWPGLFLMWFYFGVSITRTVFHYDDSLSKYEPYYKQMQCAQKAGETLGFADISNKVNAIGGTVPGAELQSTFQTTERFTEIVGTNMKRRVDGNEWGGICFAFYSLITFLVAFLLPVLAGKTSKRFTHAMCLLLGAIGLFSVGYVHDQYMLLLSMTGVGIAWASILSMPYAMLAPVLPANKTGIYMGIFNFFITIPQIISALILGPIVAGLFNNQAIQALVLAGIMMLLAAVSMLWVTDKETAEPIPQ